MTCFRSALRGLSTESVLTAQPLRVPHPEIHIILERMLENMHVDTTYVTWSFNERGVIESEYPASRSSRRHEQKICQSLHNFLPDCVS